MCWQHRHCLQDTPGTAVLACAGAGSSRDTCTCPGSSAVAKAPSSIAAISQHACMTFMLTLRLPIAMLLLFPPKPVLDPGPSTLSPSTSRHSPSSFSSTAAASCTTAECVLCATCCCCGGSPPSCWDKNSPYLHARAAGSHTPAQPQSCAAVSLPGSMLESHCRVTADSERYRPASWGSCMW